MRKRFGLLVSVFLCTLMLNNTWGQLSGEYNIDNTASGFQLYPSGSYFISFNSATDTLYRYGVSGPVTFNIAGGQTFFENIEFDSVFTGVSEVNSVIFKYEGSNKPTITPAAPGSNSLLGVIDFRNNHDFYITFQGIKINATNGEITYRRGIRLVWGPDEVTIRNCEIFNFIQFGIVNYWGGGYPGDICENNIFEGNKIYQNISSDTTAPYVKGLWSNGGKNTIIRNNEIHDLLPSPDYTIAIYGIHSLCGPDTNTCGTEIYNNSILLGDGIYEDIEIIGIHARHDAQADLVSIHYNSVQIEGTVENSDNYTSAIRLVIGASVDVKNNIAFNSRSKTTGTEDHYAILIPSTMYNYSGDYNNYYVSGNYLGYRGNSISDLSAWQTNTGEDANSMSADPIFIGSGDLHVSPNSPVADQGTPIIGITADIDGEIRDWVHPEIGADELSDGSAPIIISSPVTTAIEDEEYNYQVEAQDPNPGDILSYSLTQAPSFLTINENTGIITGSPTNDDVGDHNVTVTVTDLSDSTDIQPYILTVQNVNDSPTISDISDKSTNEDTPTGSIAFTVNDIDNDPATLTLSGNSDNLGLVNSGSFIFGGSGTNRTVDITPLQDQYGTAIITVTVSDGDSSANDTFIITVNSVNDAPVAVDNAASTDEDIAVVVDVLANDSDVDGSLVPAGVTVTGGPTNGGTSVNATTGAVTYTPTGDWYGVDTFIYTVEDDSGAVSNEATVTVTVNSVNDAPVAEDNAASTNEDIAVTIDVLANDSDSDGSLVSSSVIITGGPSNGGTSVNTTTGAITFTPTAGWNGIDTFTYTVEDDSGAASNEATVTVTVGSVNDPPTAVNDAASTDEDVAVVVDVQANDSDSDGSLVPSSVTVTGGPTNGGTNVNTTTGVITYTPSPEFYGVDTFTYTVDDDSGATSNIAIVTITVNSVNDSPVISTLPELKFNEDDSLVYSISNLYDYVADPDHPDSVLHYILNIGNYVTVTADSPNVILKAPANWFGSDILELVVSDGELSDTAQVFVTVNPINDAPVFVNWPDTVQFTDLSDTVLTMIDYVNDIDSPDTSLTWEFSVSNDTLNLQFDEATTELTLTAPGFMGVVTLYCTVTDDSLAGVQDSFTVKVIADPTGIDDLLNQIPNKYVLNQNYPNPFNPVTKIKYGLPKSGKVKIEVYNIIGQKVETILDNFKNAGYHAIDFNAGNLPSGVYFYRIQTKGFNNVKKMVLIK